MGSFFYVPNVIIIVNPSARINNNEAWLALNYLIASWLSIEVIIYN